MSRRPSSLPAQNARSGLAVLAPQPHRTTRQLASQPAHRTGDLCVEYHERICAVLARLVALIW
jgi:hypothetical protein